jgi:hypothetical protein
MQMNRPLAEPASEGVRVGNRKEEKTEQEDVTSFVSEAARFSAVTGARQISAENQHGE